MTTATTWQDLLQPGKATDFFARRTMAPFDPTTTSYHGPDAIWLAELSRIVYRHDKEERNPPPEPTRTSFLERVGLRQRRFFKADAGIVRARALIVESDAPTFAVLAFRGTEQNVSDFHTDLRIGSATLLNRDEPSVHAGFKAALDLVWPDIQAELEAMSGPIFYTGHSLGAAMATLAAARQRPTAMYTFGSPRVGNALFAQSLAGLPMYRIVDDEDIVTVVPPEELGYEHVGESHALHGPPQTAVERLGLPFGPPKPLADHAPINYVDRIP